MPADLLTCDLSGALPLGEALSETSPDLRRTLFQYLIIALLSADADAVVGAE